MCSSSLNPSSNLGASGSLQTGPLGDAGHHTPSLTPWDPVALCREVEQRYRDYLETTFYFRDPTLRESFRQALASGHLVKGPYLEGTPVFDIGRTTAEVAHEVLRHAPDDAFLGAIEGSRRLYVHQEEAILASCAGRNVVVATGTASGKTETFLLPILLRLYDEHRTGSLGPGVRALILYPMNALANDQRARLGKIARVLEELRSDFRFTFGQYIGETPENERDTFRHAQRHFEERIPGELITRDQMRAQPPHILLTNYSMLEYLLLRPDDSPLFDNGRASSWESLVVDEAHQYRGSKGMEMAFLLRRLKQRLREGGRREPFRCIATSASLADGLNDRPAIAQFASNLFGEDFFAQDVVLGQVDTLPVEGAGTLMAGDYGSLRRWLSSTSRDTQLDDRNWPYPLPVLAGTTEPSERAQVVGTILEKDTRALRLRRMVQEKPCLMTALSADVFGDVPEAQRNDALASLVELLVSSTSGNGAPLLSARYHFLLRSLEGAFLSYDQRKGQEILLSRGRSDRSGASFEVALCRECGQHYLVGRIVGGELREAIRDPSDPDYAADFFRPLDHRGEDQVEAIGESEDHTEPSEYYALCPVCGEISRRKNPNENGEVPCGHGPTVMLELQTATGEREGHVPRCSVCGYKAPDPIREVVHGTDGPHAVIGTTLFQKVPEGRRKILAFADSRQEAAFYAWYLEQSYEDLLHRNLIVRALDKNLAQATEGLTVSELAGALVHLYRKSKVFPASTGLIEIRKNAWMQVYRELLTDERRISLEGVGLIDWEPLLPDGFHIPAVLLSSPWNLTEEEAATACKILLDSMRDNKAVELLTDLPQPLTWQDLSFRASQYRVTNSFRSNGKDVRTWGGERGRRYDWAKRLLLRVAHATDNQSVVADLLDEVWEEARRCGNSVDPADALLLRARDGFRANPRWWRARLLGPEDAVFRCDTCGRLQGSAVKDVCNRYGCHGQVHRIQVRDLPSDHYRRLYKEDLPGRLRVEEHTAQLTQEKALEFQRSFQEGKIHVLSSSTTFELGVDLGDLDIVFLRNVPPEPFNYAQRVGRAGRRKGLPGMAITYCRRSPHDLYHFAEPEKLVKGSTRPPVFGLGNTRIASRHALALVMAKFFRANPSRFKNVVALIGDMVNPTLQTDLETFVQANWRVLEDALKEALPATLTNSRHPSLKTWILESIGKDSPLAAAEAEVTSDYRRVIDLKEKFIADNQFGLADWANRRATTIAQEPVTNFLSRKAVIPKYGFPVDVVELDTQSGTMSHRYGFSREAYDVALQRDLSMAISEFAPTAEVVANKQTWTSYGLKTVAGKSWPRRYYKKCDKHNLFTMWSVGEDEPPDCGCHPVAREYLIPSFGFVTSSSGVSRPSGRPVRMFSTRPYFVRSLSGDPGHLQFPGVDLTRSSPGLLVVLCEGRKGQGFYVCQQCGSGMRNRAAEHKDPFGRPCNGTLSRVSLGHEFQTDVVQLQFSVPPVEFGQEPIQGAYALAFALVEGLAEILEVPPSDLNTTVAHGGNGLLPPIVIYDNVPGGAGLVSSLEKRDLFRSCIEKARDRLDGRCGCSEDTSCYGCLRSYRNQFAHQWLRRGPAHRHFDRILELWRKD